MNAFAIPYVAIAAQDESYGGGWKAYCCGNGIRFTEVDLFDPELFKNIYGCTHLLARPDIYDPRTSKFAASILQGARFRGIKTYPNHNSFWHFDDKVAQKYLLEGIGAPLVPSYVMYSLASAIEWIQSTQYPFVFKLRKGAGSANVRLIRSPALGVKAAKRMFSKGEISTPSYFQDFATKVRKTNGLAGYFVKIRRLPKVLANRLGERSQALPEKGYFYAQKFFPGNSFDTRVVIIGNRAFAFRRFNRPNDFRASGSGEVDFDPSKIDQQMVEIAHGVSSKLGFMSMAYDFIYGTDGMPYIVEMSYSCPANTLAKCPGYWTREGGFVVGSVDPRDCIIEDMLNG